MTRRIFFDTEFLENGETIELISIGMVDDQGNEFYAVNSDIPVDHIYRHKWLRENVLPHLPLTDPEMSTIFGAPRFHLDMTHPAVKPKWVIRNEVLEFLAPTGDWRDLELWAYYGAYDHVVLAQLWGRMIDLPAGVPMFTNDLMTLWMLAGCPEKPSQSDEHHALEDARWNSKLYDVCLHAALVGIHGGVSWQPKAPSVVEKTKQPWDKLETWTKPWAGIHVPIAAGDEAKDFDD